jgi:nucleoid-associated protein YgaU
MFKSSAALLLTLALCAPIAQAQEAKPLQLQADAPDRHVVVKGDTLWAISGKFLKDPWRWPEVWGMNKEQIKNPHLIYPGDVVVLDRASMTMRLERGATGTAAAAAAAQDPCIRQEGDSTESVVQGGKLRPCIRESALVAEAIPTIPAKHIEPFLSYPLLADARTFRIAPRIVATQEGRYHVGAGNIAYARGITEDDSDTWNVFRTGPALIDPETNETYGYEAIFLGTARVVKTGDPATLRIMSAKREISEGDRLLAASPPKVFAYAPHPPVVPVRGRVMSIYGGNEDARSAIHGGERDPNVESAYGRFNETGPLSIITINRGLADGVETGTVLALHRGMVLEKDRQVGHWYLGNKAPKPITLPEERFGLLMVFRAFEHVSYALVVQAERPIAVNDIVQNP